MSVFYDHLLASDELDQKLQELLPDASERKEVLDIFDATLHHAVLDIIFACIPIEVHELFLVRFHSDPAAHSHLGFLRQYEPEIDRHIKETAAAHRAQFIDSIHA